MALSHGVARTTRSASAAPALSAPPRARSLSGQRATTSLADRGRPLRVTRTERDPDAGLGQPDRDPAPSRTGPTEDSHVHAPTFA